MNLGDLSGITLADLRDLETIKGEPIGALFEKMAGGDLSGLDVETLVGLIWLRMRKDDPGLTLEDVYGMDLGGLTNGANPDPKAQAAPDQ